MLKRTGCLLAISIAALSLAACGEKSTNAKADNPLVSSKSGESEEFTKKHNGYVETQNQIVTFYKFRENLDNFEKRNASNLASSKPLESFLFYGSDVDSIIKKLEDAQAIKASVPDIDPQAKAFLDALKAYNPTVKALKAYESSKEYTIDGGKKARELAPTYVTQLKAVITTYDAFADALTAHGRKRDEARLAKAKPDSLAFHLITTSLTARDATAEFDVMAGTEKPSTDKFLALLSKLQEQNAALDAVLQKPAKAGEEPSSRCGSYHDRLNDMVGDGRQLAATIKSGRDPSSDANSFIDEFNRSVDSLNDCEGD